MQLDLKDVISVPDAHKDFSFSLDLSKLSFYGEAPLCHPVAVSGAVVNHAGALTLEGVISTTLHQRCDRCGIFFLQEKVVPLDFLVATHLENEENDEILLLEGTCLDMEEVVTTAVILALDTKKLCREQCQGLCITCGTNLNQGACTCKKESDSPFAALAQLLEEK